VDPAEELKLELKMLSVLKAGPARNNSPKFINGFGAEFGADPVADPWVKGKLALFPENTSVDAELEGRPFVAAGIYCGLPKYVCCWFAEDGPKV
jgi:hypothetical protein